MPVHAISVCYDYVYYRLTEFCEGKGKDPAPPGGSAGYLNFGSVTDYMSKNGYALLIGPNRPLAGHQLKRGDVIVIAGHIGFVNGPDDIDHFIQVEGTSRDPNARYSMSNLPRHETLGGRRGGFFQGDTLKQFLDRPFSKPTGFNVWRRDTCLWAGNFKGNDTSGYAMNINLQENKGKVTGGWTFFHKSAGANVTATITSATVVGNTLQGTWTQTGVPMTGNFTWRWLADGNCNAFEGSFNGTRYWTRMNRSGR
jgi:hypothetical protein